MTAADIKRSHMRGFRAHAAPRIIRSLEPTFAEIYLPKWYNDLITKNLVEDMHKVIRKIPV